MVKWEEAPLTFLCKTKVTIGKGLRTNVIYKIILEMSMRINMLDMFKARLDGALSNLA